MRIKTRNILFAAVALVLALAAGACAAADITEQPEQAPPTDPPAAVTPGTDSEPEPPANADDSGTAAESRTVIDQAGREVVIEGPVERIVSGYYISTSAAIALGLEERLAGIEARADSRPIYALAAPELLGLPNVGTLREFNMEGCIALEPDLVILSVRLRDSAQVLSDLGIPVILVEPETPQLLIGMIGLIGDAADVADRAQELIGYYEGKLGQISALAADIAERPAVYMGGVGSYLTTAPGDMYQSSLIEMAGGQSAAADIPGNSWMEVPYEQLLAMNPEVIVIPSEAGYGKEDILADPQLAPLDAVRSGSIYQMPGSFEAWDSPVTSFTLGIEWLLSVLHADILPMETVQEHAADFYRAFYDIEIDTSLIGW